MNKPVFVNDKEFSVQVGTPSGAGRIVNPGLAVEGDYFASAVNAGMPLRRLSNNELLNFDKKRIVMSISLNEGATLPEAVTPNIAPEVPDPNVTVNTRKAPDAVNKNLDETLNQALHEMGTAIPTATELSQMTAEQLRTFANRYNISVSGSRQDIIKQLRKRLSV